ncbi:beta-N-acetylhexosaminidase [Maribellus sp. YY47]|uniref:beta-N-acetylhexosaminidase n=1 Tax=Maribellus sp. YY47 TaxID=2929486 RepID=UPI002000C752|nr:beta-N-acetylhexosaminidase [Maribellus sp. YY47]MCK3685590.1 beta-N-acetylhexosaminidase [Maribellus sp. YY47]
MDKNKLKRIVLTFFLSVFMIAFAFGQIIIPQPNKVEELTGTFRYEKGLSINAGDKSFELLIPGFVEAARRFAGVSVTEKRKADIQLVYNSRVENQEGYRLSVEPQKITVEASSGQGCFYGLQSLLQLILFADNKGEIKCLQMEDEPRYSWRGLMLDESRHFFGKTEVEKLLDQMALLKLNKFHWHLTDEPGWRIEIRKYPLLTQIGGLGNYSDPKAPARYYTQDEIKEILAYAAERFIEIIPEIDMPGHATAAVKAYPEYSGGGSEKHPDFTFNPGNEATYSFLTDILREVSTLFPSDYIHIGGDEVSYGNQQWPSLPGVKKIMNENGLEDLVQVEHYFLRRMSDSIQSLGNKMLGWDEVVSSGINSNRSLVMWWRHDKPEVLQNALNNDFQVVLCPRIPLYFDFVQDEKHISGRKWGGKFAPLESVYRFPSDDFLPAAAITDKRVLGIQANLWTETIDDSERLEFMTFPRISAFAESGWTRENSKNYEDFQQRISKLLAFYKKEQITVFDFTSPNSKEITGPVK